MKTCHTLSTTLVAALLFLLGTDHVLPNSPGPTPKSPTINTDQRNPRNGKAFLDWVMR